MALTREQIGQSAGKKLSAAAAGLSNTRALIGLDGYRSITDRAGTFAHAGKLRCDADHVSADGRNRANVSAREEWRRVSVVGPVVTGTISGFGRAGYRLAIEAAVGRLA